MVLKVSKFSAADSTEHPFVETKGLKSETCLQCHPDKNQGKFVHTAVGMGCENCHTTTSENNKTTITLVASGGDLCAMCHEATKDDVQHAPFKSGQCLICHDPHSSEFKAQTRAEVNSICLACHGLYPPQGVMAKAIDAQKISQAVLDAMPKIELDRSQRIGHPWVTHPVAQVSDPLHAGERMSCLSCHAHHSSMQDSLIVAVKGSRDVCTACHQLIDEAVAGKSKGLSPRQAGPQAPEKPAEQKQ